MCQTGVLVALVDRRRHSAGDGVVSHGSGGVCVCVVSVAMGSVRQTVLCGVSPPDAGVTGAGGIICLGAFSGVIGGGGTGFGCGGGSLFISFMTGFRMMARSAKSS